jgi:hypothetical protein
MLKKEKKLCLRRRTNTPPHFLKDSTSSPKVKTMEGVRVRSLAHNTLGVEGCAGALGWELGKMTSGLIIHMHQTPNWLVHNWNTFGAWTNHKHTRTHKIHHGPSLGEASTFPLIVFSMLGHGG